MTAPRRPVSSRPWKISSAKAARWTGRRRPCSPLREFQTSGALLDGYETIGALRFREIILQPGEAHTYLLVFGILPPQAGDAADWGEAYLAQKYAGEAQFDSLLAQPAPSGRKKPPPCRSPPAGPTLTAG